MKYGNFHTIEKTRKVNGKLINSYNSSRGSNVSSWREVRRHHNNKGYRQVKRGKCRDSLVLLAEVLGINYKEK